MKRHWPLLVIVVMCILLYVGNLSAPFVGDDGIVITRNTFIRSWGNVARLFSPAYFTGFADWKKAKEIEGAGEVSWRPLTTFSYFLDYALYGLDPFGYRVSNLFFHLGCGVLVYILTLCLFRSRWVSSLSSAFFLFHPVTTEVVNAVSFRDDSLACFFYLASIIFFLYHDREKRATFLFYALSLLSFFLALGAKEMAITLPLVLVWYGDCFSHCQGHLYLTRNAFWKSLVLRYLPFFLAAIFFLLSSFWLSPASFAYYEKRHYSVFTSLVHLPRLLCFYIGRLILPKQLALFLVGFAPPEVGTPGEPGGLFFAYLLILLMVVVLIRVYRRKPSYAFFGGWLFITLLPVSNLLPLPNPVAWRYLYLPSVGFACSLGLGLWWLGAQGHEFPILKEKRKIINIIAFSLILFYATIAFSRNLIWRDDLSLMLDSVYYYPQNPQTHYNLGRLYYERGQTAKAEEEFGCVIQLAASHKGAHRNLGRCYFKEGRFEAAEREFVREIQLYPDEVASRDLLGFIALERKNLDRAAGFLREAAQLDPEDALSYAILGEVYFQQGDYGKAQESWGKALQLRPGDGFLLYRLGRLKELLDKRTGRKGEEG